MEYTDKDKAIDLYLEGKTRREISLIMDKPLRTVQWWTAGEVSALAMQLTCAECGKQKRTLNIQKRYCSPRCKNRADYQRRLKRKGIAVPTLSCAYCGEQYQPAHLNSKRYCTPQCRKNASIAKRLNQQAIEVKAASQSKAHADRQRFTQCLELLWQARHDDMGLKISGSVYREQLDFIADYNAIHRPSFTAQEEYRVQEIFRSVR